MLFPEEDTPLLKAWIVKRIEHTSDADSDVLADYVIALLKHDGPIDTVRTLCEEEIPMFLTEDSKAFLDDVFRVVHDKSYRPGRAPASVPKSPRLTSNGQQTLPVTTSTPLTGPAAGPQEVHRSKKRRLQDRGNYDAPTERGSSLVGRFSKQPRRQRRGAARGGNDGILSFNGMPTDPMQALMQMQALGLFTDMQDPGLWSGAFKETGRCQDFDQKGFCSRGNTCPYDHSFMPRMEANDEGYDLNGANMFMNQSNSHMNPFAFVPNRSSPKPGQRKSKGPRKAGPRDALLAQDRSKNTIQVQNIPKESLSEEQVRAFFSQFGDITDVSMKPHKHLAFVKYNTWNSANAAYHSPKAIFDNRFVKVLWHQQPGDSISPSALTRSSYNAHHADNEAAGAEPSEEEEPFDIEEFTVRQQKAQKVYMERQAKRSAVEKLREDLEQNQHDLLAKHKEETDKLQARLAEKNGGGVTSGTDMLRAKLAQLEQEAKMLGIDPNSTDDISSAAPYSPRGGYRGRGGPGLRGARFAPQRRGAFRGQEGRHAAYAQYSLDNRPRKLTVTGVDFTQGEKDELLRHFLLNLGEFESVDTSPEVTQVSFRDRKTAEKFYHSLQGKELPGVDGKLELEWVNVPVAPVHREEKAGGGGEGSSDPRADEDSDEGMAGALRDGSEEGEVEEEPVKRQRVLNMDYEVADDDPWDQ